MPADDCTAARREQRKVVNLMDALRASIAEERAPASKSKAKAKSTASKPKSGAAKKKSA